MLSARNDEIVPPSHMDILFALSRSEDKIMYKFDNCLHNDTILQEHYWARVHDFLIKKVNPVGYWTDKGNDLFMFIEYILQEISQLLWLQLNEKYVNFSNVIYFTSLLQK